MISKGQKIKHRKNNTIHIVDSIEYYDNLTLLYTEDTKCFPSTEVDIVFNSKLVEYFISSIEGEKTTVTENEVINILKKNCVMSVKESNFDEDLDEFLKNT